MTTIARYERLLTPELTPLLDAAGATDPTDVAALARLRRQADAPTVTAALELAQARHRAADKFPHASRLVADREGVEQATSHAVAGYKASRFADGGDGVILDLCCGIGGDTMALARRARTVGVDRLPLRAWMAARNGRCETIAADVTRPFVDDRRVAAFHIDPARRIEAAGTGVRTRTHQLADAQPGPAAIERAVETYRSGAAKLGPGVDAEEVPRRDDAELEWIADRRTLVQCVAWYGDLARANREPNPQRELLETSRRPAGGPGQVRATALQPTRTITHAGTPFATAWPSAEGECGEELWVPNPAIERTGLAAEVAEELQLRELFGGLGIATGSGPTAEEPAAHWFDRYRVIDQLPWRTAKVRAALARHDAGVVTVKTRGRVVDANRAAQELRGHGSRPLTVFALRFGEKRVAVITVAK